MSIFLWEQDKKAILDKISHPSTLKICAKVLDEPLLIQDWIEHHAKIVGLQNLIIADNMSTNPDVIKIYKKYSDQTTIFQFSGPHNQIHWHPRFETLFDTIKDNCRFFSFIDADERLVSFENDRWVADESISTQLESTSIIGIIPTTWIINSLDRFDMFTTQKPDRSPALMNNLKWGKPILPSDLVGSQSGIHNIQYEEHKFSETTGTHLFLLHLTQFPNQRIFANRNKLVSRGIIEPNTSPEDVINLDFSRYEDQTFMPLVHEMREMFNIRSNIGRFTENAETIILNKDGTITFSSDESRSILKSHIDYGESLIKDIFRGGAVSSDKMNDPSFLLRLALTLRSEGRHQRSEAILINGVKKFPSYPAQFGGPAFQKELLRLYLAQKRWSEAAIYTPESSAKNSQHWHEVLYARAYQLDNNAQEAIIWWKKVLSREPDNGEARSELQSLMGSNKLTDTKLILYNKLMADFDTIELEIKLGLTKLHGFIQRYINYSGIQDEEYYGQFLKIIKVARDIISKNSEQNKIDRPISVIPKLIHRIWLTNPGSPTEPPDQYLDSIISEASLYSNSGWSHYLWVQSEDLIPQTQQRIRNNGNLIKIIAITDGLKEGAWTVPFQSFLSDRKFPFAADILRMKILYEFGGIYADMGARFIEEQAAQIVVDNFDYAFIFWETMFFQNSLMMMKKHSDLATIFLKLVENPYSIPAQLLEPLNGLSEGMAFSGLIITIILMNIYNSDIAVCPLAPNGNVISWSSQKSWYTPETESRGKHGNAYVPATGPSFLREDLLSSVDVDVIFLK